MPDDDNAARLSLPESELPPEPVSLPGEATVTPIASRLGAAAGMGGGRLGGGGYAGGGSGVGVSRFRPERSVIPDRSLGGDRSLADRPAAPPSAPPVPAPPARPGGAERRTAARCPSVPTGRDGPAAPTGHVPPAHYGHAAFRDRPPPEPSAPATGPDGLPRRGARAAADRAPPARRDGPGQRAAVRLRRPTVRRRRTGPGSPSRYVATQNPRRAYLGAQPELARRAAGHAPASASPPDARQRRSGARPAPTRPERPVVSEDATARRASTPGTSPNCRRRPAASSLSPRAAAVGGARARPR